MTDTGNLILIGLLCLAAGMILGALIHRGLNGVNARNRRLAQQLDQLREEHTRYQAEVSAHFSKTAELFGKLNNNYRELLNHLAVTSERLADNPDFKRQLSLTPPGARHLESAELDGREGELEPPRDYAPKSRPDEKGTLSEDFGIEPRAKP